ncbi:hypothetical protein BRW65_18075 [Mycobacterium paraffinicum]|uniref:Uncharacterized protein n=1 Tax=Mycobacterium paraffinicum TaxID=53378 RepID=A0A1Q4HSD5_9MYCO|nr:hypothetical protein [Mycobacterium paraffinicum]OJZ71997.1 hypothetical protein BRW65_18075 [Mycobacterium paraffinicum]
MLSTDPRGGEPEEDALVEHGVPLGCGEADQAAGERRLGEGSLVADLHALDQDDVSQTLPLQKMGGG